MIESWKVRVLILAGKCPVILKSSSHADVLTWITAIDKMRKKNEEYQVSVYRYWARIFYRDEPEQLKNTLENIALIMGSRESFYTLAAALEV